MLGLKIFLGLSMRYKHVKIFLSKRCFGVFISESSFNAHQDLCYRADFDSFLFTFPIERTILKFKKIRDMMRCPVILYADFECLLRDNRGEPT